MTAQLKGNTFAAIAEQVGCIHDGDDDNRIHAETIRVDISDMSEADYDAMEVDITDYEVHGQGFVVYAWNDASGYDYWKREGHNYIQVTANLDDDEIDTGALRKAIAEALAHFSKYSAY
jgi:hypothetical protein